MSHLELGGSFELGGYFVAVVTGQRRGAWCCWVEFEQDAGWDERCVYVPVYRHRVPGMFRTRLASLEAGFEYAQRALIEGTVAIH